MNASLPCLRVAASLLGLAAAAFGQGTFTPVDSEPMPGPGDNMVVVERGRAQYIVTLSNTANTVHTHRVEPDGSLTPLSTAATGNGPRAIAMARDGDFAIIVNSNDDTMSVMSISGTGALSEVGRYSSGGDNPFDVAVAFEDLVVVANRDSDSVVLFGINRRGVMNQIGNPHPTGVDPHIVTIGPQGTVAVANSTSNDLTIFDLDRNGNMSLVDEAFSTGNSPKALAFGQFGFSMFVATRSTPGVDDQIQVYAARRPWSRNPQFEQVDSVPCGAFLTDLEAAPDLLLAVTVDPLTGRDQVRGFDCHGTQLTPNGTITTNNGMPSFKNVCSAKVPGPIDRAVFVSEFQGGWVRSLTYDRPAHR